MIKQICLVPRLKGLGGMVSFQAKLIRGLQARDIAFSFDPMDHQNDAILIIGGSKNIFPFYSAKARNIPIIQRLNGMNWLHKIQKTNYKTWAYSQRANFLLNFIRRQICHEIIYQSEFSQQWWEREFGRPKKPFHIIYNGVDLDIYTPSGPEQPPLDRFRILLVEGHLTELSSFGLEIACKLVKELQDKMLLPIELVIAGDIQTKLQNTIKEKYPSVQFEWKGIISGDEIPALDRSAHLLFSADINAACPNSVIEALACGLPVLSYDTGALKEIVNEKSGNIVPYGSNHWKLETPDISALVKAAIPILKNNNRYRIGARNQAVENFSLDKMVDDYLQVLIK